MGPPPLGWPWDTPSPQGTCPGASCQLLLSPGCHRGGQQAVAATQAPVPRHPGPPAPCQGQGHPRGAAQLTLLCWGGCQGPPPYLPVPACALSPHCWGWECLLLLPWGCWGSGPTLQPLVLVGVGLGCSLWPLRDLYQFVLFNKIEICFSPWPSLWSGVPQSLFQPSLSQS